MTTLPPEPQQPYQPPQYGQGAEPPTQPYNPGQYPPPAQYPPAPQYPPPAPQYPPAQYPPAQQYPPAAPQYPPAAPSYEPPTTQYPAAPGQYPPAAGYQAPASAPPGYPPQPGYPAAPAAPKKSRRNLFLLIGAIVLVVCCGGAIGGGLLIYNKIADTVTPISSSADSFFKAVVNNEDAYSQLCTSAKASIGRAEFQQGVQTEPLKSFKISGVYAAQSNLDTEATVTVALVYAGRAETHVVPMVQEDGTWKVCGRPY